MSRAALGHTGRPLKAHAPTVGAYVLISVAAVLRVGAALIPTAYMDLLMASGIAWTVGFALFLWLRRFGSYDPCAPKTSIHAARLR
jgi:uncharacterized protein involved in response to NO